MAATADVYVTAIERTSSEKTAATTVVLRVTTDSALTADFAIDDFVLTAGGDIGGAWIGVVSRISGTVHDVVVDIPQGYDDRLGIALAGSSVEVGGSSVAMGEGAAVEDYAIDTQAPDVVGIRPDAGASAAGETVDFIVEYDEAVTLVDIADFGLFTTGSASGVISAVSAVSETVYRVSVQSVSGTGEIRLDTSGCDVYDVVGNIYGPIGFVGGEIHEVDRDAPAAPTIGSQTATGLFSGNTFTVSGTTEPNSVVRIFDDAGGDRDGEWDADEEVATAHSSGTGAWSIDAGIVANATVDLLAVATDAAGNVSGMTALASVTSDTVAPDPTGTVPADGGTGVARDATLAISFAEAVSAGAGSVVLKNADGDVLGTYGTGDLTGWGGTGIVLTPDGDLPGNETITLEMAAGFAVDAAGNGSGAYEATFTTVNVGPAAAGGRVSAAYGGTAVVPASAFGFTDADGDTLASVLFAAAPETGTLWLDADGDRAIDAGETRISDGTAVAASDVALLTFAAGGGSGPGYATATFRASDGTAQTAEAEIVFDVAAPPSPPTAPETPDPAPSDPPPADPTPTDPEEPSERDEPDPVEPTDGADELTGTAGDDVITGGGDDILRGGAGRDVVAFDGPFDDYVVVHRGGRVYVTDPSDESVTELLNVEVLRFADGDREIAYDPVLGRIASLYERILGRQADGDGFDYWVERAEVSLMSLGDMALSFLASDEALRGGTGFNWEGMTADETLTAFYQYLLGRTPDGDGFAYWMERFADGATIHDVAAFFVASDEMGGWRVAPEAWDFLV